MTKIRETIVQVATTYLGQKEKPNNYGFIDPAFEKKLKGQGFLSGQPWCAYFTKLVWSEAFAIASPFEWIKVGRCLTSSAVSTFTQSKTNRPGSIKSTALPGDLIVWRKFLRGEAQWQGHIGIVVEVNGTNLITIEGNSNSAGGREGIEVAKLKRSSIIKKNPNGLVLLGFISPEY